MQNVRLAKGDSKPMPDLIRVYGAFPIARNDAGEVVPDHDAAVRCESADAACLSAEAFSRTPGYVAGVAFTRLINLVAGECSRPEIIMSFGDAYACEAWSHL